jgi:hypothetical protein
MRGAPVGVLVVVDLKIMKKNRCHPESQAKLGRAKDLA